MQPNFQQYLTFGRASGHLVSSIYPISHPTQGPLLNLHIGQDMDDRALVVLQAALTNHIEAEIQGISTTIHTNSWTSALRQRLEQWIPERITYRETRIIDPERDCEVLVLEDKEEGVTTSSIALPIDAITDSTVRSILSLQELRVLHVLEPLEPVGDWEIFNTRLATILQNLPLYGLESVILPLDTPRGVQDSLRTLIDFPELLQLELRSPHYFDIFGLRAPHYIELENMVNSPFDFLPQLEHVNVPLSLLSPYSLATFKLMPNLNRLFARPTSNLHYSKYTLITERYKGLSLEKNFSQTGLWTWP